MTYVPRPEDIAWARSVVGLLKDGGIWGHPEIGAIYRIDHVAKLVTLVEAEPHLFCRPDNFGFELVERTKAVFAAIGYKLRVDTEALAARGIVFGKELA